MREIKFRAWLKDYEEMIFWDLFDINQDESGRYYIGGFKVINKDDLIVMQYTGLHDKNGKEIFEGDRIKVPAGYEGDKWVKEWIGEVIFAYGSFMVQDKEANQWVDIDENDLEVIGNIFENPEKEGL